MSIVTLTDKAKAKINELCAEKNAFAVSLNLKGGGCAGFEYDWGFVEESEPGDELINTGTGNLVIGKFQYRNCKRTAWLVSRLQCHETLRHR